MKVFLGVDLGSTTCKAVVLDQNQQVAGKGITNTRSNYAMAVEIATKEALTNARFSLLEKLHGIDPEELASYETLYHVIDYQEKHRMLQDRLVALVKERQPSWVSPIQVMGEQVTGVLGSEETRDTVSDRTKFFKDLMYASYLKAVEDYLPTNSLDAESFLGLLDKALVMVENEALPMAPEKALKDCLPIHAQEVVERLRAEEVDVVNQVGTGYGRQLLPFEEKQIRSEIMCHARGAYYFFPSTRTVLDIGGQDTKAIQLDENGIVRSFFMNDRCAAGCGRYLGYVADELAIGLSDLGPSACRACKFIPITSTCTVFAGAELRDLLYAGEDADEILLGLHRAIVLRAMSLLARSGGVFNEFTFTGGVAKNMAVVKVLRELVSRNYEGIHINIHPDSIYMGAIGAALYAKEAA